jgi:primary-amine oxidase
MDVDVNGEANSLEEIDVMYGRNQLIPAVGLRADTFALRYEQEARRQRDDVHMRTWRISGPNATGFSVITNSAPHAPLLQTMVLRRRSEFTDHDVWTTTYKPTELLAAGLYPNQADDIGGLPLYVKDNTSIARQDIVLWHNMGLLTIPSANDVPSMRTRHASVTLLPSDAISLTR